jgi:hypothetical protein
MKKISKENLFLHVSSGMTVMMSKHTGGTATGWMVRGSNLGGGEIFRTRSGRSWAHPASYTMGTGSFPGVKRPGRGIDHSPHLAPRLKKEKRYTYNPLWALVACSRVTFTFTIFIKEVILMHFTYRLMLL